MPKIDIKKNFYCMAMNGASAEITMYGDIVESRPRDWWTGKEVDGQYIVCDEFLKDLDKVNSAKSLTIRMNSCGGDAGVSILIHNRLREMQKNGKEISCIVDGVAMSGGSLIMCACDNVKVNASSIIMIHKCWSSLFGGYSADELRSMAASSDAYDKAQASIYHRKTGLDEETILSMMAETTYMSGKEAKEKGFADEIIEGEGLAIAASADGQTIFVGKRAYNLTPGMFAPDIIPTAEADPQEQAAEETVEPAQAVETNTPQEEKGGSVMAMTIDELRSENPELAEALTKEVRASAVQAERERLRDIDEVSALLDPEMVREAKYGENACSAQELTYRAAKEAAKKKGAFLADMEASAEPANEVPAAKAEDPVPVEAKTPAEKMAEARKTVADLLKKED